MGVGNVKRATDNVEREMHGVVKGSKLDNKKLPYLLRLTYV
jgi:hypothetical protein